MSNSFTLEREERAEAARLEEEYEKLLMVMEDDDPYGGQQRASHRANAIVGQSDLNVKSMRFHKDQEICIEDLHDKVIMMDDKQQALPSFRDDSSYEYCKGFSMQQFKELKGEEFQDDVSSDCAADLLLNQFPLSGRREKSSAVQPTKHKPKGGMFQGYQHRRVKVGSGISPRIEVKQKNSKSRTFIDRSSLNQDLNLDKSHDSSMGKLSLPPH